MVSNAIHNKSLDGVESITDLCGLVVPDSLQAKPPKRLLKCANKVFQAMKKESKEEANRDAS